MDIATAAADYHNATQQLLAVARTLRDNQLDVALGDGWTPRQVIHHLADSETQSYARIRRLIAEPGTIIQGYETLGITTALEVFKAVRQANFELISRLTDVDLKLSGIHTESGEYSVQKWLQTYTKHPVEHAQQITQAIASTL